MLYFSRWKVTLISLLVIFAVAFALPNILPSNVKDKLPSAFPSKTVNLGLDLQGGVHILFQIEKESFFAKISKPLVSDIRKNLLAKKVRYSSIRSDGAGAKVKIINQDQVDEAVNILNTLVQPVSTGIFAQNSDEDNFVVSNNGNVISVVMTEAELASKYRQAISQSIEVIRKRVDSLGTKEPVIQRQGDDRIIVQVPGLDDPERLKKIIGKTAILQFRMLCREKAKNLGGNIKVPPNCEIIMPALNNRSSQEYYVVSTRKSDTVEGSDLTKAYAGLDQQTNSPIVNFSLNNRGGSKFARITRNNVKRAFAIILDNKVVSAPTIETPITGGSGRITGSFTIQETKDLALVLQSGALPAKFVPITERTVGPGLGSDSINSGKIASAIGMILVVLFIIIAYRLFGLFANIALAINITMIIAALSMLQATLTLPGIAGIVLTIGMAVDANVLIFERIKEELRLGKSPISAIDTGYSKALATILDANITTFIAAAILFWLGSGPIKGFAVTLAIGIVTSVFTAFTLTRLFVAIWVKKKRPDNLKLIGGKLSSKLANLNIPFMKFANVSFIVSWSAIVLSVFLFVSSGLNLGIDFRGGSIVEVKSRSGTAIDLASLRQKVSNLELGDVQIQEFGSKDVALIRLEQQQGGDKGQQEALQKIRTAIGDSMEERRVEAIGPTVSSELAETGIIAVVVAIISVLIYVWFRFEWQFSVGAVLALVHDVVITVGLFALLGLEFNLSIVAALLTIVGYSLNDTVVVFDRVRENLRKYKKMPIKELLNNSINTTISRTILTSITTLIALLSLYIFGGEVIRGFTFAMIWGVVIGTYSSIFIASPILSFIGIKRDWSGFKSAQPALDGAAKV